MQRSAPKGSFLQQRDERGFRACNFAELPYGLSPWLTSSVHKVWRLGSYNTGECAPARQQAAMGGANPAAPAAHNLGSYCGTGDIVPFCTCGSLMAK